MKAASALAFALAIALPATPALAQSAKALVGSWTLVSAGESWGKNPKGRLMLDANGHYSLAITRADLPKFTSNSRVKGTAEENKASVLGSIVHFGRYKVEGKDLILSIEASSFPNWIGTTQTRTFTVNGDDLSYVNPKPSAGGAAATKVVWKRAK